MNRVQSRRISFNTMNATDVLVAVCAYLAHVIVSYYTVKIRAVINTVMSEDSVRFDLFNLRPEFSHTCDDVILKQGLFKIESFIRKELTDCAQD